MHFTINRLMYHEDGIFSVLQDDQSRRIAYTLEHAYPDGNGGWTAKVPLGNYKCVRGAHRLHGMTKDFETFEVTGVPDHKGILFHWGNFNKDSEGCFLLGAAIVDFGQNQHGVTSSKATFQTFMKMMGTQDEFDLTVRNAP